MYRILAFDGGGIRGILSLILVRRLEKAQPGFLAAADLISGTSVGGIIAMGLACGYQPSELEPLFEQLGNSVFARKGFASKLARKGLIGPKYEHTQLKEALDCMFGDRSLRDLPGKVMVTSFFVGGSHFPGQTPWKPKIFHNLDEETGDPDVRCVDVALYTSSAPSYFPSLHGYVDGGVVANNPSMCAYALVKRFLADKVCDDQISLLSIGTGDARITLNEDTTTWGTLEWAPFLMPLLMDGPSKATDYQCRQILGDLYYRLNIPLPEGKHIGLDDSACVKVLSSLADEADLSCCLRWLEDKWKALCQ